MVKNLRVLSLWTATTLVLVAPASGQLLVEHAAAAAGAAGGAAAGKAASDALNNLGNLLGGAARTGEPKQELPKEVKPKAEKPANTTPQKARVQSARASNRGAANIPAGAEIYPRDTPHSLTTERPPSNAGSSEGPVPVYAPRRSGVETWQARSEDLQRVQPGMSRSEVLALGSFGSRITIPEDDGHIREVLQYDHATVRMEDGTVTSVSRN